MFGAGDLGGAREAIAKLETDVFLKEKNDLLSRIQSLEDERAFARLVALGMGAIDNGNYTEAKKYFLEARGKDASSVTVNTNLELIEQLERAVQIERLRSERQKLIDNEKFLAAMEATNKLEVLDPSITFGEQKEFLRAAIDTENMVDLLLPQMTSMASSKLREAVEALIHQVESGGKPERFGVRVSEKFSRLKQRYVELGVKSVLSLRSDGDSEIFLRPGGRLGHFKHMKVKLYPGTYRLIARCPGLQEKVDTIVVPVGESTTENYIGCY